MTTTTDQWIEDFIVELRLRHVPGPVIGDAVASVHELLTDSGQSPEEAFGSAREYAAALELPAADSRHVLAEIWAPVVGLIVFLSFAHATTALFLGEELLFSAAQIGLLAVVVAIAATIPLYLGTILRHRWLVIPLIVAGGAAGIFAGVLAPATASEAVLAVAPEPWLIVSGITLFLLSTWSTIVAVKHRSHDEIVEPLADSEEATRTRYGWDGRLLLVHWLFPIFAAVVFLLTWWLSR